MAFESRQILVIRHLIVGVLILLLSAMFLDSNAFARGRKGGGAAGALDDFDLFLMIQTTNGLPVNLINGFEPANSIAGDGTVGVGGTIMFDPNQPTINSQSGEAVTLLPASVNGDNDHRAGMPRKLGPDGLPAMLSLKTVPIPSVPELTKFIRNKKAAIALGKALFWDVQAGSDGNACASCHFHAGADNRIKNQLSSGLKAKDPIFQNAFKGSGGPNYKLDKDDFPFHRLADPLDRNSAVLFDSNDVVSSQGTFGGEFQQLGPNGKEFCGDRSSPDNFNIDGVMTRRVAPRNTPSTINAVFNFRNFWDGRANNIFNGVSPFGPRDTNAKVLELLPDGTTVLTTIALRNASLASQAVGPVLSDFEMSCANRTFKDLGRKMLSLQPLRQQKIHPHDSVLGAYITKNGRGISQSYPELIRAAFDPRWWNSQDVFDGYTHMESNFSLYWGLAIMMYESTLVSDETPFDKLVGDAGHPSDFNALTTKQLRGLGLFRGKGQCLSCHKGAEFTGAGSALQPDSSEGTVIESMLLKTGELAVYDNGFYNIGVRPADEDLGLGDTDPFGNALSLVRNWFDQLSSRAVAEPVLVDPCRFSIFFDASACWIAPNTNRTRIVADGAFKTPSLRNVSLTQPYFHNGSRFTLEQVVEFYNRGGDRRGPDDNDTTGFISSEATNGGTTNLHPAIKPLGLTPSEIDDLVSFMRHGLTDPRVACEQAPFDHPSLRLHNGHVGDEYQVSDEGHDGKADDQFELLPAVGRNGRILDDCLRNDDGSPVGNQAAAEQAALVAAQQAAAEQAALVAAQQAAAEQAAIAAAQQAAAEQAAIAAAQQAAAEQAALAAAQQAAAEQAAIAAAQQAAAEQAAIAAAQQAAAEQAALAAAKQAAAEQAAAEQAALAAAQQAAAEQAALAAAQQAAAEQAAIAAAQQAAAEQAALAAAQQAAAEPLVTVIMPVKEPLVTTVNPSPAVLNMGAGVNLAGFDKFKLNKEFNDQNQVTKNNKNQNDEIPQLDKAEINNDTNKKHEIEHESHHDVKPAANVNGPDEVLVHSPVTMHGSVSAGATFVWTQIEGQEVVLRASNTLAPNFTAPNIPVRLVFELTATNASGDSTSTYCIINVVPDVVTINQVTWKNLQNRTNGKVKTVGELNIIATSSMFTANTQIPIEMTMTAQLWSKDIATGLLGSSTNPVEVPMTLVRNSPSVCSSKLPCFTVEKIEGIANPHSLPTNPLFVPPTSVIVKSTLGGFASVEGIEIQIH